MKKLATVLTLAAALLLLAGPATAGQPLETLSDTFNPDTGTGFALIWIGGNQYAYIQYLDVDGNGQFSAGDTILRELPVRLLP